MLLLYSKALLLNKSSCSETASYTQAATSILVTVLISVPGSTNTIASSVSVYK